MEEYLPSPPPPLDHSRDARRNAQYQHLVEVAKGVERWIRDTQPPPSAHNVFWNKELAVPTITIDNRVKKQTPLLGVANFGNDISIFRHDISEAYGYLRFIGSHRHGVYTYSRLVWHHWKYWDPME